MENVKMICFDMDGTIVDFYGVSNWLGMIENYDPTPYAVADPLWNMVELVETLRKVHEIGIEINIITWLSKGSTKEFDTTVRQVKREWLERYNFPFDHFHGVAYGATKADSVRKFLAEDETAILFDDNAKVRKGWHLGETVDPTEVNIIEYLKNLLI